MEPGKPNPFLPSEDAELREESVVEQMLRESIAESEASADEDTQTEADAAEFLALKRDLVLRLIYKGLVERDGFAMLDAENHLTTLGQIEPTEEVVDVVLQNLQGPAHAVDFDLIRVCSYLRNERIVAALERQYDDLKQIWRELDELRFYESNRFVLEFIARRASELSALRVAADRYLSTLDSFFEKNFNESRLGKFPLLKDISKQLLDLRSEGRLNKDSIEAAVAVALEKLQEVIDTRTAELTNRKGGGRIRPNRIIAVYYCLLEALLAHGSSQLVIDDEFLDKVSQDFRAAHGDGTKRFVLNALLRLRNENFSRIATEASYSIKAPIIEKMERKEAGELEYRTAKVSLGEMQNFDLYQTAAEVIACNPSDEVFDSLLQSFNAGALLLGLKALEQSNLPPVSKLFHVRTLLERGTMDAYVFTRSIQILTSIESPGAAALLGRLIMERFGWRKARMPEKALAMIQEAIYRIHTGSVASFAHVIGDSEPALMLSEPLHLPYEEDVYTAALGKLAIHFKRNIFHGTGELAQHRLFRAMVNLSFRTRRNFAKRAKLGALQLIRRLYGISDARLDAITGEFKEAIDLFSKGIMTMPHSEKIIAQELVAEARGALTALQGHKQQRPEEERELRSATKALHAFYEAEKPDSLVQSRLERAIGKVWHLGPQRMRQRDKNLIEGSRKNGVLDSTMLSVCYPASDRAIVEAAPAFFRHYLKTHDQKVRDIIESFGIELQQSPPKPPAKAPTEDETRGIWKLLSAFLSDRITSEATFYSELTSRVTAGAAANGMIEIIESLQNNLYENNQHASLRLAFLFALPPEPEFGSRWRYLLAGERITTLLSLRLHLPRESKEKLKRLVPDLLDLID